MDNKVNISLKGISLSFPLYSNSDPNLKSNLVNLFNKKDNKNSEKKILRALDNIDLEVKEGQTLGLIGRNGAGKSTLIRIIAEIYDADEGEISINGNVVTLMNTGIGFNENLDAIENIKIAGNIMRIPKHEMENRISRILNFAELEDFARLPIKYYSKGMQTRLGFTTATEISPEILLLDEVFSGGDMHWMKKANERLVKIMQSSKIVIIVSHSMELIRTYCNRIVWLESGKLKMDGDPEDIVPRFINNE